MQYSQEELETMFSQRNVNTVLYNAIRYEMDKSLINFGLYAYINVLKYINKTYSYDSKNTRIAILREQIAETGLDDLIIRIACAVLYTHNAQTIQQCVGYLQGFLKHEDSFQRATTAGELLAVCSSKSGLYEIKRNGSGNKSTIVVHHWGILNKKLFSSFDWINDTCFNLPMIEQPQEIKDNYHCGYKTINEPLLLGEQTMHEFKQVISANNLLNKIEWVLDWDVLAEPEVPSKTITDPDQHKIFSEMVVQSRFVYNTLGTDPFHFCWQNDSRGRLYTHGYHVNFQAAEYKKASLSFNKWEYLT